jgi:hypothetical protein
LPVFGHPYLLKTCKHDYPKANIPLWTNNFPNLSQEIPLAQASPAWSDKQPGKLTFSVKEAKPIRHWFDHLFRLALSIRDGFPGKTNSAQVRSFICPLSESAGGEGPASEGVRD